MNINELKEYHLKLYERIHLVYNELYTELILESGINLKVNSLDTLQKIVAGYDEQTDTEKIITSKINELETYYITIDCNKESKILDMRTKTILKKYGFEYGNIIYNRDTKMISISLYDTLRPK